MIYFYDDIDATNSIRISNSEIAELDLIAKIKESDLDKYFKKYLKKDTNVWFYYDLSDLAEDYDCQYVQSDEFGLWYTDENKKYPDIWKKSMKESINSDCYIYYDNDDNKRLVFCDYVKGITDTSNWFYLNEYIIDAIHIFKNEKQAQKFIDEHLKYFADQDKVVIAEYPQTVSGFFESKESARKSIKESADDNWYKLKVLNEMLDAMEEDEYNIPKLGIYGVTKNINLDIGAIQLLIDYYK